MNPEIDIKLVQLFAENAEIPSVDAFTSRVMKGIVVTRRVYRIKAFGLAMGIAILVVVAWVPILDISVIATRGLIQLSVILGVFMASPIGFTLPIAFGVLIYLWGQFDPKA